MLIIAKKIKKNRLQKLTVQNANHIQSAIFILFRSEISNVFSVAKIIHFFDHNLQICHQFNRTVIVQSPEQHHWIFSVICTLKSITI